jgi:hypothetical protein
MIDQIIDAGGKPVCVDLHLGDLCAQGRETFAQALAEVLEARSVEVLCRGGNRSPTKAERNRCAAQIEKWQDDVHHGLKSRPIVSELES